MLSQENKDANALDLWRLKDNRKKEVNILEECEVVDALQEIRNFLVMEGFSMVRVPLKRSDYSQMHHNAWL